MVRNPPPTVRSRIENQLSNKWDSISVSRPDTIKYGRKAKARGLRPGPLLSAPTGFVLHPRSVRRHHRLCQLMQPVSVHHTCIKHVPAGEALHLHSGRVPHQWHLVDT
jgi:hypothetical protein